MWQRMFFVKRSTNGTLKVIRKNTFSKAEVNNS